MIAEPNINLMVGTIAWEIRSVTGSPLLKLVPRSPVKTLPNHWTYRTGNA